MITALVDLIGTYYQAGNLPQMAAMANSLLVSIPEDLVALQFLGLALFKMGRVEAARQVFAKVAGKLAVMPMTKWLTTGELATVTVYREAVSPASGLGDAWLHVAMAMQRLGFGHAARQAGHASLVAKGMRPLLAAKAPGQLAGVVAGSAAPCDAPSR